MMGVYEIINLHDGKMTSYVGSSVDVAARWRCHVNALRERRHKNPHLQCAWDKCGEGSFSFCVLEQVTNEDDLLGCEQYYLDRAFEMGDTYNIARDVAMPMLGRNHTGETKQKMADAAMGRTFSEETRQKLREANRGQVPWNRGKQGVYSKEVLHEMGKANRGKELPEETRRRMSRARMGHEASQETRRKISEAMKGKQSWLGHHHTEETKRKISKAIAKPYPAFVHQETGAIIMAGHNLSAMCERHNLSLPHMHAVKNGKRNHHKGWELLERRQDGQVKAGVLGA